MEKDQITLPSGSMTSSLNNDRPSELLQNQDNSNQNTTEQLKESTEDNRTSQVRSLKTIQSQFSMERQQPRLSWSQRKSLNQIQSQDIYSEICIKQDKSGKAMDVIDSEDDLINSSGKREGFVDQSQESTDQ